MTTQSKLGLVWALNGGFTAVSDTKYEDGWASEIPSYQNFNYMVQTLDKNILKYAEEDVFDWDASITYATGAKVKEGSIYYTCKAASTGNSPVLDTTNLYWVRAFLIGDDFSSLLETDGHKIELPARSTLNYAAVDMTISNNAPLVKLKTTSGSVENLALANIAGEAVIAKLGTSGPDARDLSLDAGNSHRIFHEGHVPTVSEVTDAVEEANQDSVLYARKDGAWVKVTSTTVSSNTPTVSGDGGGWYNLEDGQLYLDIYDGDTSQWVPASPPQVLDHYTDRVVDETITGDWTFDEVIASPKTGVFHNVAGFYANTTGGEEVPSGWVVTHASIADSLGTGDRFTVTHNLGRTLWPTACPRSSVGKYASVSFNDENSFSFDVYIPHETTGDTRTNANIHVVCPF